MMEIIFSLLFMSFNKINKIYLHLYLKFILIMLLFFMLVKYSLNNNLIFLDLYNNMGMDSYSLGLISLSFWIVILMIMGMNIYLLNMNYFLIIYMILMFLIFSFYSMNLMWFYIYFESSLIPVYLLILGWGYQVDRIQASVYMMLYTLFGSLPLLLMLMKFYLYSLSMDMTIFYNYNLSFLLLVMFILAFLIKMPMYFMHLWLPKAHVEAPVVGSMILAGVMLKLGSYGLMRILMMLNMLKFYLNYFLILSLMGGIYSSLICMNQLDMKVLVAYSSVVHMSMLMAGLFTLMTLGLYGGYIMMLSHGLCSSGLFYLVNLNYLRSKSRSFYINKGMVNYLPSLSFLWFLMISSNLSFPPSLNLISEVLLAMSLIIWNKKIIYLLIFLMFFSAIYSLYLYSYIQHGKFIKMSFFNIVCMNEFLVVLMHWFPLNYLIIFTNFYF